MNNKTVLGVSVQGLTNFFSQNKNVEETKYSSDEVKAALQIFLQNEPYKQGIGANLNDQVSHWENLGNQSFKEHMDQYEIHVVLENMMQDQDYINITHAAHEISEKMTSWIESCRRSNDQSIIHVGARILDENISRFSPNISEHLVGINPDGSLNNDGPTH